MVNHFTVEEPELHRVIVFPYLPLSLDRLLAHGTLPRQSIRSIFRDLFSALSFLKAQRIIHRDLKPSAVLLETPDGPAYLSDFGISWHPTLSRNEPPDAKVLDVGTGGYRAPDCLFGNTSYDAEIDCWGAGALLAEACRKPPKALFESRPAHEDGSQLGLILSIFRTIGSPTPTTWPEAEHFRTPPWAMWKKFDMRPWHEILPDVDDDLRDLVSGLLQYGGNRITAEDVSLSKCWKRCG